MPDPAQNPQPKRSAAQDPIGNCALGKASERRCTNTRKQLADTFVQGCLVVAKGHVLIILPHDVAND